MEIERVASCSSIPLKTSYLLGLFRKSAKGARHVASILGLKTAGLVTMEFDRSQTRPELRCTSQIRQPSLRGLGFRSAEFHPRAPIQQPGCPESCHLIPPDWAGSPAVKVSPKMIAAVRRRCPPAFQSALGLQALFRFRRRRRRPRCPPVRVLFQPLRQHAVFPAALSWLASLGDSPCYSVVSSAASPADKKTTLCGRHTICPLGSSVRWIVLRFPDLLAASGV